MYCILVREIYSSLDDPICIRQLDFDSPKAATAAVPHDLAKGAVVVSLLQRRPLHSSTVPSCSLRRRLVWSFNDEPEWVLSAQQQAKDGCLHVSIIIDYSALLRMEYYLTRTASASSLVDYMSDFVSDLVIMHLGYPIHLNIALETLSFSQIVNFKLQFRMLPLKILLITITSGLQADFFASL